MTVTVNIKAADGAVSAVVLADPVVNAGIPFADATNTGPVTGTVLHPYPGTYALQTDNMVVENFAITIGLVVFAKNVTIRNCTIVFNDFFGIDVRTGATGLIVEHCTITGPGVNGPCSAVINADTSGGMIIRYCNISQGEHGIALGSGAATVLGNYLHDPDINPAVVNNDKHVGGVSFKGGQSGVLVQDNRITCSSEGTSDIFVQAQFGPISNVIINHNFCGADPGYNIYVEQRFGFPVTNISITNNTLVKGHYDYYSFTGVTPTLSGNILQ